MHLMLKIDDKDANELQDKQTQSATPQRNRVITSGQEEKKKVVFRGYPMRRAQKKKAVQ